MKTFVSNLNFPTSLAQGPDGTLYIAESGLPFGHAPKGGRVLRVDPDGHCECLLSELREPVNGLLWHDHGLIVAEGGKPGRISRLNLVNGEHHTILDGLPGFGNYQTNMTVLGPDGKLYFSQGSMTNSGVIGADSNDMAWLLEVAHDPDLPGYTITLADQVFHATDREGKAIVTGPFAKYRQAHPPETVLPGQVPCTAAVMRCNPDGSQLELVAWGLRNGYGLGFLPDGRLIATDQGADVRGVRPVWNCPDFLYEIKAGAWYGWPDYYGGIPITDPRYRSPDGSAQPFILANHDKLPVPEQPLLAFAVNACAVKFAQVPAGHRFEGQLFVAQFGDERPMTGPAGPRVGRNLVRVKPADWSLHALPDLPVERPIDLCFGADGQILYVLDFGEFEFTATKSIIARAGSGRILQVTLDQMEKDL